MSILYVVSESDNDAVFCALCAGKLTGRTFLLSSMKNRKGDGVEAVKVQFKYAVRMVRDGARSGEQMSFIAAMDNDRAPHPENSGRAPAGTGLDRARLTPKERDRSARLEWMIATVESVLGANRNAWPLPVALAVPVEMLESWIVCALRAEPPQPMLHFSFADSDRARRYYAPSQPPPQWKDLTAIERGDEDMQEFLARVVKELNADALAQRSLSFRMFKEWIDDWPRITASRAS